MIRFLQTPGPTKKIILSSLLLIICGGMVITLIPGGLGSDIMGQPSTGVVAKVAGQDITVQEVRDRARALAEQQVAQYGPMGKQLLPMIMPRAIQQSVEQMITGKAIVSEADRMGLKATDEDVRDELQHGVYAATLFPDGKFIGEQAYENLLQKANLTVSAFESDVKNEILERKLAALITGSASVSDADLRQEFQKRNTKVKFDYAVLSQDDIRKGLHPTDEELKAFYTRNQSRYKDSIPEKRKVQYVFLDKSKILSQIQVSPEDLKAYYEKNRDQYRVPDEVKVAHIEIKTPQPAADGKVDEKAVEEARKKAEDVLKQLKGGAKFEDLAKKYSEDPSGKQGGEVGWIGRGRTAAEFEKTAFSQAPGQTSDLVKTGYGFHIIRTEDKHEAHTKTLDEVKAEIEPLIKQQKASRMMDNAGNSLLEQARSQGLEKAAAAKNLNVVTTDFVGRSDVLPGIGASPQLMDAIFSEREKSPPDMAQLSQGAVVFVVDGIKPPATPSFEEIRSKVDGEFKNERASILLNQKTQELSDRAKSEHDLRKAAKELGATMKTSDFVLPDGQVPDVGSMAGQASVAFSMKPGEISGPVNAGNNGVVLSVLEKQEPTDQDFAAKKDQIRDNLLRAKQQDIFEMFISNLRQQMEKSGKIKINEQEMKNLTKGQGGADVGF
ncbi:MAG TPA: peptidyl-prolyl cis-trans isomerase [Terriglobales bacterium]|nr:peptidyl-prolyl cis-trans isomerase [Terriglobales bacterium]